MVPDAVKLLDQEDVVFLDVRTSQEFNYESGIKNALLIPINDLEKKLLCLRLIKVKTLLSIVEAEEDQNGNQIIKRKTSMSLTWKADS